MIEFLLGEASRIPAKIYFLAIVFISFVICVGVASCARSGGMTAIFSVFKSPALLAFIPALAFNLSEVEVPVFFVYEWFAGSGIDSGDAHYTWSADG